MLCHNVLSTQSHRKQPALKTDYRFEDRPSQILQGIRSEDSASLELATIWSEVKHATTDHLSHWLRKKCVKCDVICAFDDFVPTII